MADFKGVIQRAISGLANNTPEARTKIYDRARQTVQRQLDALPEGAARVAFEKQKLRVEEAIAEVESTFSNVPMPPADMMPPADTSQSTPPYVKPAPQQPKSEPPVTIARRNAAPVDPLPDVPASYEPEPEQFAPTEPEPAQATINRVVREPVEVPVFDEPAPTFSQQPSEDVTSPPSRPRVSDQVLPVPEPPRVEADNEERIVAELDIPQAKDDFYSSSAINKAPVSDVAREELADARIIEEDQDDIISKAVGEIRSTLDPVSETVSDNVDETVFKHDEIFGLGAEALPEAKVAKPKKSPFVILIALILIVAAGAGYFVWRTGWNDIQAMIPFLSSTEDVSAADTSSAGADENSSDNGGESVSDQTEVAVSDSDEKFNQRLNPDGTEIDVGPAESQDSGANEEGRSVASQTQDEITAADGATGADDAGVSDGASTIQRMFFYETSLGLEQQAKYDGSVVWSEKTESDGTNSRPYIEGRIQVPDRNIELLLTIKLNGDKTLPVSHLIDLAFELPEDFDGGEIEQVTEVKFKDSEEQTGVRLAAISAKIEPTFFIVGLQNDDPEIIASNIALMRQKNWIDIPISYVNGRKALITLEKGATGQDVFDKVLAFWEQNPIQ